MPTHFEPTPDGQLFAANGLDPMMAWDGQTATMRKAGVPAPTKAPRLVGTGKGPIFGTFTAYMRFVDKDGNVSNLSPLSDLFTAIGRSNAIDSTQTSGTSRTIVDIRKGSALPPPLNRSDLGLLTNQIAVKSPGHGIPRVRYGVPQSTNLLKKWSVRIQGVLGCTEANGTWTVRRLSDDWFYLYNSHFENTYTSGGTWANFESPAFSGVSNAAPIVITSNSHGLATGDVVRVSGVKGNTGANGVWIVTVITAHTFSLNDSAGTADYLGGGIWRAGIERLTYANLQVATDPRVVRRQLLRSTDGQARTYYVDLDTADLTSTSLISEKDDDELKTQEAVPLFDEDNNPLANRYGEPPTHKTTLAHCLGRMFAAGEDEYTQGQVMLTFGSKTVTGVGTEWTPSMDGRFFYAVGGDKGYEIDSVSAANQTLTLKKAYNSASSNFVLYAIRAAPAERRLVYWSEANLSHAWPAANAFELQENGDEITGLLRMGSFVYILEKRHIHRFSFEANPARDGGVFPACDRGCINNRCHVTVEGVSYMLDRQGVHAFSGGKQTEPISAPIAGLFRPGGREEYKINWNSSRWFHAAHFPSQETVRFFTTLAGEDFPRHAICYAYRHQRWWIEEFPFPVCSSAVFPMQDHDRVLLGSTAKRVFALWVGTLDACNPDNGTVRGTATSSSLLTLTDSGATFDSSNLAGTPVVIVAGTGKGQLRLIASATGTALTLTQPWLTLPDTTSEYQVGGIAWRWKSGWFRWLPFPEPQQPRRLEVTFQPTSEDATMDVRVYKDFADDPMDWGVAYASNDHSGVQTTKDDPDAVVDLTKTIGFAQQRIDARRDAHADGWRQVAVELKGVTNEDEIEVFSVGIDGASR